MLFRGADGSPGAVPTATLRVAALSNVMYPLSLMK
jgi:hypothetical protein